MKFLSEIVTLIFIEITELSQIKAAVDNTHSKLYTYSIEIPCHVHFFRFFNKLYMHLQIPV